MFWGFAGVLHRTKYVSRRQQIYQNKLKLGRNVQSDCLNIFRKFRAHSYHKKIFMSVHNPIFSFPDPTD